MNKRSEPSLLRLALPRVLLALVIVALVQAFVVRVHSVSSSSMENTLGVQDRVLSSHLPYVAASPQRGDIVIFRHGENWTDARRDPSANPLINAARAAGTLTGIGASDYYYTVKRVIGVTGDTVACCTPSGAITVNGTPQSEPYVFEDLAFVPGTLDCASPQRSPRCFAPVTVPPGRLLVLGDHRGASADSVVGCRPPDAAADCARFVTIEQVTGKVIAKAWPPGPVG